jgi:nucleoid-associated protein YgaU
VSEAQRRSEALRYPAPMARAWRRRASLAAAACALAALPLCAEAFPHVVQPGETLAGLAEQYYGRVELEKVLVAENGLDLGGGVSVVPGLRLEIPAVMHHRSEAGETWADLAERLLGDRDRSDVLAGANDGMPWTPPRDGQEILVPYNLRVVAGPGDSTLTVAYRFLGERDRAWMLDKYNHLKGEPLRRGDLLLVPLVDLPLTEEGKAAARESGALVRSQGAGSAREAQRRVDGELPGLAADLRGGRYLEVVARGNRLLGYGELAKPQLASIHRKLVEAYVALDAMGLAETSCAAFRDADPSAELEPDLTSPKIVRACSVRPAALAKPLPDAGAAPSALPRRP